MSDDDRDVVQRLFHTALQLNGEDRARFLDQCGADAATRHTLERLLAQDLKTERLSNTPTDGLLTALPPGTAVGPYEIVGIAGRGGMGLVYRAKDTRLKRDVAIKTLPTQFLHDADLLARFQHEARVLASLNHPNIAMIYDILQHDDAPYLVLEFVDGPTLAERLREGPLQIEEVVQIGAQIALALQAAHAKGVVHRDLKPRNIVVARDGQVKVLDFGLAIRTRGLDVKAAEDTTIDGTRPGALMGTIHYMSPEQALGWELDHRSDIFSTGVLLYQMTTGRQPFSGRTDVETINAIINEQPEPVASLTIKVSPSLKRAIARCLQKERDNRFQSASELLSALKESITPRAPVGAGKNNLQQPLTRFIGRTHEIAQVRRLLSDSRLLTLTGPGGIGKTRLALHVATESQDEYGDGVWFVELAALTESGLVPQTVALTLSIREQPGRTITETLVEYLKPKNLLLVLDNCEQLVGACAQLADALLRASPRLRVLTTSREALGITGETVFRVPALSLPDPSLASDVESIGRHDAVELFLDRARATRPGFAVTNQNAALLAKVCARLEGIPLAIELAASRMKVLSIEQIDARLHDRLGLLTGGSRTALPRHQTLLAAIDWSYDLLSAAEQTLFRRLSAFSGGWALEAAEIICAGDGLEKKDVLEILSGLVDKSLVVTEERETQQRYRFMGILLEYAQRRLLQTQEADAMSQRHADYFLAFAKEAQQKLSHDHNAWLALSTEYDNLRAVLSWASEKNAEIGLRLADTLVTFWTRRGYWSEARKWLSALLQSNASPAPADLRVKALNGAGDIAWRQGDYGASVSLSEEALAISREWDDKHGVARALHNLGKVAYLRGDYLAAWSLHEESLMIAQHLDAKHRIAVSLSSLGLVAYRRGDYDRSRSLHEQSLVAYREVGDVNGVAASLTNLGNLSYDQGDFAAAMSQYQESLSIQREQEDKNGIASTLNNLGLVAYRQGDYATAWSLQQESLSVRRAIGDRHGLATSLDNLGIIADRLGDYAAAAALHQESLSIRRELGDKRGIAMALNNLGFLACRQGDYAKAQSFAEESLAISRELGSKQGIAESLSNLGESAYLRGEWLTALSFYRESLSIYSQLGGMVDALTLLDGLAAVALRRGQYNRAVRLWGATEALRETMSAPRALDERDQYDRDIVALRTALSAEAFAAEWSRGRQMTEAEVIAYALREDES